MELINKSEHIFTDISTEEYRIYEFDNKSVKIDYPLYLAVSASGGHRILDNKGISHYIPTGWVHLLWKVRFGAPHFVK